MADAGPGQAIELGVAYVSIVGETDKLARSIRDAVRDGQRYATTHPISIKADVDVSHIGAIQVPVIAHVNKTKLREELRDIGDAHVNVDLRTTNAEIQRFAAFLNAKLRERRFIVHLIPAVDTDLLRQHLRNLPDGTIKVNLDISNAEFARFAVDLRRRLRNERFILPVGLDLTGEAAFRARLDALLRNRNIDVDANVNVDRNGLDRLKSLGSIGGLGTAAGGLAAVGAGLAVIGGAAGAALGAVGALGVGIASLGPVAAAAGATVAVGIQGIGDAFKALSAAEDSAGADGQAQAKAVAAAQDQLETALDNVTAAQQNQAEAVKEAEDAHKDIAQAYKEAADELEDYQFKLRDAALSEKEAALGVREAQEEIATAKTPAEREKAILRLQRAQLRYDEAVEKNKDTQEAAADAQAKGIEGADKVVAAKDKAAQADQRVAEAQKAVQKANEQVAKAQQAVADAANMSSSAQDKAAQALAKLSPNAQAFVLAARAALPAWQDLTHAVQDNLFDGAAQGIQDLVANSLPTLKAGMVDVAGSMNGLTKQFVAFWQAPQNLAGITAIFAGTKSFIDGLGPGLQQATQGFLSLSQAFSPVANQVGAQFANMLGQIGQAFTDAFNNGSLTQLIGNFGDILQGLGQGLKPLIDGLIQMGNIVGPTLGPFFKQLGESIQALAPSFGSLGATFMTTLTRLLPPLQQFLDALARGLEPVLPVVGRLLEALGNALTPLIGPMEQIAVSVGAALVDALNALAPAIGPLGQAFATLIAALAPIIPVVAEVVSGLIQALAPALTQIFEALGPVIKQWADLMMPVFQQLQPIIADVASKIADALVSALNQLAPYLPDISKSFGSLITAIAPLMPQLVEITASLLPPLLDLFIAILPQLLKLIDAFTWLVNSVIEPLVLPALKMMADNFGSQLENAAKAVTTARDVIGGAVKAIGDWFSGLGDTIKIAWDVIVHAIAVSVKKVGELLQKVPSVHIPGTNIDIGQGVSVMGTTMVQWAQTQGAAAGGLATASGIARPVGGGRLVRGPGTGTSDSILAMVNGKKPIAISNREFISTEQAYENGAPLLWALNQGWVPSPEFLAALVGNIPGFATGGVPGKAFAQSMDPAKYLMGGFSRTAIDCSGMVSATINDALGLDPFSGRMSTVSEGPWLSAKGALPGLGGPGDISIGWYDRGGGANGHTALTLGDGTNVESNGTDGVVIGGPVGASASMFDQHMHIPAALLRGGDLGGPATGNGATGGGGLGGTGGGGLSTGGSGGAGAAGAGGSAAATSGATPVFVVNWPYGGVLSSSLSSTPTDTTSATTATLDTSPTVSTESPTASHWWEPATPEAQAQQFGSDLAKLDIPNRAGQALADFGTANLDQFIGDLGFRKSGGAVQALVSQIFDAMAKATAEAVAAAQRGQQGSMVRHAGRPLF